MQSGLARREALPPAQNGTAGTVELALIEGDLSQLSAPQRLDYYQRVCESLGLNPYTKPFDYLKLNGKLLLYAKKDCTEQLRKIHRVSTRIVSRERIEDVWVVTAQATDAAGRYEESIGAVPIGNLKGEALANALMKAETKAKRRVTLSICGLGVLDESETDTLPDARVVPVNPETGEVIDATPRTAPATRGATPVDSEIASAREEYAALYSRLMNADLRERNDAALFKQHTAQFLGLDPAFKWGALTLDDYARAIGAVQKRARAAAAEQANPTEDPFANA